jgi:hypothetical protein
MESRSEQVSTFFAPAGRDAHDELARKYRVFQQAPLLQQAMDAIPDIVLILNERRQIVSANQSLLSLMNCEMSDVLGKRPGELVGCRNAGSGPDGCGTAKQCMTCGAVEAILGSGESDRSVARECRIALQHPVGGALDFRVHATAMVVGGERLTVCVLKDISDQKRLGVLARVFFHDVINTAGGIIGFTESVRAGLPQDSPQNQELAELEELAEQLLEEIESQRDLTYAEAGELEPDFQPVAAEPFLMRIKALYSRHPVALGKQLVVHEPWKGTITTDKRLLGRVLGNMIKNALEATDSGGTVTVRCVDLGAQVAFRVHNTKVMPEAVQMQVFQRSFSTKRGAGRGIGTHSMKLFGERYLAGEVSFTSREPEGTTFSLVLPKRETAAGESRSW